MFQPPCGGGNFFGKDQHSEKQISQAPHGKYAGGSRRTQAFPSASSGVETAVSTPPIKSSEGQTEE
jgi:hypothetical protein